jgi:hypothetical protein
LLQTLRAHYPKNRQHTDKLRAKSTKDTKQKSYDAEALNASDDMGSASCVIYCGHQKGAVLLAIGSTGYCEGFDESDHTPVTLRCGWADSVRLRLGARSMRQCSRLFSAADQQ